MKIFTKSVLIAFGVTLIGYIFLSQLNKKKKLYNEYNISLLLKSNGDSGYYANGKDIRNKLIEKLNERASQLSDDYSVSFHDEKVKIEMKGVSDTSDIASFFTGTNALEIWELYNVGEMNAGYSIADKIIRQQNAPEKEAEPLPEFNSADSNILSKVVKANPESSTDNNQGLYKYFDATSSSSYGIQILGTIKPEDSSIIFPVFRHPDVMAFIPRDAKLVLGKPDPGNFKDRCPVYAIKTYNRPDRPMLTDNDIQEARQDYNITNGKPTVLFKLNPYGSKVWENLTRRNVNRGVALIVDNLVITAPTISTEITGGSVEIAGNFSVSEAIALATSLDSGRLPVSLLLESYEINKSWTTPLNQKMLLLLIICFLLSGVISYFLFARLNHL